MDPKNMTVSKKKSRFDNDMYAMLQQMEIFNYIKLTTSYLLDIHLAEG